MNMEILSNTITGWKAALVMVFAIIGALVLIEKLVSFLKVLFLICAIVFSAVVLGCIAAKYVISLIN